MEFRFLIYVLLQFEMSRNTVSLNFEEITNEIFPIDSGLVAAFCHFNSDEFTDVISLQQGGNRLQLLKGSENRPYFEPLFNCSYGTVITSVVPGDFNGDSLLDILITLYIDRNINDVKILWGNNVSVDCKSPTVFRIKNQPLVVDFNGDMMPDIIGESISGGMYVWISNEAGKFTNRSLTYMGSQKFRNPHSSGLIDLNNDLASDILITGEYNMELWYNTGKEFIKNGTLPYPTKNFETVAFKWQSTFVDMDLDGKLDHIIPVCYDRKCEVSAVLIWDHNASDWYTVCDSFKNPKDNVIWGFKIPMGSSLEMAALPVTLRVGDVDMDGYPDFIAVLQSKRNATDVRAVIFQNVPCHNGRFDRCLKIEWEVPGLKDLPNVQIATFFDIFEDGILDILVSTNSKEWKMHALKNTEIFDSCFLKVLVLSGLCYHNCSVLSYGVNQPGPIVRYNMTKQDGQPVVSNSIQLSQSAYFPLQLPYSIFGLGQTPNFIDVLTISIPAKFTRSVHKREWIQIIPNSQIVVIPYPPSEENKWVKKLFVTPSHLVLLTCISLVGTCTFLAILVALLHWKERKEDKKEKMQDAYRFHFDAM